MHSKLPITAALESVQLHYIPEKEIANILNGLIVVRSEHFNALNTLRLIPAFKFLFSDEGESIMSDMNHVIQHQLIPFFKAYNNRRTAYCGHVNDNYMNKTKIATSKERYFEPLVSILDHMPESLLRLRLQMPHWKGQLTKHEKNIFQNESNSLVKRLCEMLIGESQLEMAHLDNVRLSINSQQFLIFMFGYNRKCFVDANNYSLSFI
eukprot:482658_1